MKKITASLLSFMLIFTLLPLASAASHADNLYGAIESTLNSPYINANATGELKNDKNVLSFTENLKDSLEAQKVNAQLKLDFDTANLPKMMQEEADMDFSIKTSADIESFLDKKTQDAYGSLTDFTLNAKSSDADTLAIIEGFAEYPKIVIEKVFHVNMKDLIATIPELNQEDISAFTTTREDIKMLFKAILGSGFLEVKLLNSNVYEVTLTKDVKKIDFIKFVSSLKQVPVLKNNPQFKDLIAEMPEKIDENTMTEFSKALEAFHKYNTFKTVVHLESDKISVVEHFWTLDLKALVDDNNFMKQDTSDIKNLEFYEKIVVNYNETDISYTPTEKHTLNINKMVNGVQAMSKKAMAKYEAYSNDMNVNGETTDYTYDENIGTDTGVDSFDLTEIIPTTEPVQNIEEILNSIDKNAWYYEHVNNLASKGILNEVNPEAKLTKHKLYILVTNAGGQIDYSLKGSNETLTKLEAIKMVIKAFYPEVNNPIKFALDNQVIKNANITDLKNSTMIEAELYKVLDKTLNIAN